VTLLNTSRFADKDGQPWWFGDALIDDDVVMETILPATLLLPNGPTKIACEIYFPRKNGPQDVQHINLRLSLDLINQDFPENLDHAQVDIKQLKK